MALTKHYMLNLHLFFRQYKLYNNVRDGPLDK
jgi:hypothetical protein